jgi:uncharacterized protein YndB with AHSA1/START domain
VTEIVVEQRIKAPAPNVYRFLVTSDAWLQSPVESAELDATPGGIFSLVMPDGMNARGQFTELVPDERLEFTWGWVDRPGIPPGSTVVSIVLTAEDDGTLLTLTHRNLPADEAPTHLEGWRHMLPSLAGAAEDETA